MTDNRYTHPMPVCRDCCLAVGNMAGHDAWHAAQGALQTGMARLVRERDEARTLVAELASKEESLAREVLRLRAVLPVLPEVTATGAYAADGSRKFAVKGLGNLCADNPRQAETHGAALLAIAAEWRRLDHEADAAAAIPDTSRVTFGTRRHEGITEPALPCGCTTPIHSHTPVKAAVMVGGRYVVAMFPADTFGTKPEGLRFLPDDRQVNVEDTNEQGDACCYNDNMTFIGYIHPRHLDPVEPVEAADEDNPLPVCPTCEGSGNAPRDTK